MEEINTVTGDSLLAMTNHGFGGRHHSLWEHFAVVAHYEKSFQRTGLLYPRLQETFLKERGYYSINC